MSETLQMLAKMINAADSVKLRLCDDAEEYSDLEKHRALNNLYDCLGEARQHLADVSKRPAHAAPVIGAVEK